MLGGNSVVKKVCEDFFDKLTPPRPQYCGRGGVFCIRSALLLFVVPVGTVSAAAVAAAGAAAVAAGAAPGHDHQHGYEQKYEYVQEIHIIIAPTL